MFQLGKIRKKALNFQGKGHGKRIQDQAQVRNFLKVKLNLKLIIQKITVRFMTIMTVMI